MKLPSKIIKNSFNCLLSIILILSISACSDSSDQNSQPSLSHAHDDVTDMDKHIFEHEFAEQCMLREVANSGDPDTNKYRFEKPCMCIATYMMKDLTAVEAEKFLKEQKNTQSLRIRFENAAYNCLQKRSKVNQAPVIFKQR